MAISFGPKLGLLYNSLIGESYYDSLRLFLQTVDALVQGSVINATQSSPPTSPNPGDAYLLTGGTPSGQWTGRAGNIAVWDAQLTNSGTNTVVPGWIFLSPNAGWIVWNVALSSLIVYNGTSWSSLGGGANFPTNTNITSMTGIPNTAINTTGYTYSDGTNPQTIVGDAAVGGGATPNGFQYGSGIWSSGGSTGSVLLAGQGPWTGLDASGYGFGASVAGVGATVLTANGIQSSGTVEANFILGLTTMICNGELRSDNMVNVTPGVAITFTADGLTTAGQATVLITGAAGNIGLLGFSSTYSTQTTVGAAGSASALPGAPKKWIPILDTDGSIVVFPVWAHA